MLGSLGVSGLAPRGSEYPSSRVLGIRGLGFSGPGSNGLGPNFHTLNGVWTLKPYYFAFGPTLGPLRTLQRMSDGVVYMITCSVALNSMYFGIVGPPNLRWSKDAHA